MFNYEDLNNILKKSALGAIENTSPMKILIGKVTSISPLTIMVNQKFYLQKPQLILTKNVIDYEVPMTSRLLSDDTSVHNEKEKFVYKIYNGLKVDDKVLLLQNKGGQKFLVIEKVVD